MIISYGCFRYAIVQKRTCKVIMMDTVWMQARISCASAGAMLTANDLQISLAR